LLQSVETADKEVQITVDTAALEGILAVPQDAIGAVVFVHGSGSSRFSPRNAFVAQELQKAGMATLLIDLLTPEEDAVYETRFDIDLLTERLGGVLRWLDLEPATKGLAVGLFGASTGAAAALKTAARMGERIAVVVSRGGRPDLAMDDLPKVVSPTLLIVGGADYGVIELNEQALAALQCEKKLEIVPGATHLFEELGALEQVAALATEWFNKHLK
jgi:putative phosphoribosyl transferase